MLEVFLAVSLDVAQLAGIPPKEQCTALLKAADEHWWETHRLYCFDGDRHEKAMGWANHRWYLWSKAVQAWERREHGDHSTALWIAYGHLRLLRQGGP